MTDGSSHLIWYGNWHGLGYMAIFITSIFKNKSEIQCTSIRIHLTVFGLVQWAMNCHWLFYWKWLASLARLTVLTTIFIDFKCESLHGLGLNRHDNNWSIIYLCSVQPILPLHQLCNLRCCSIWSTNSLLKPVSELYDLRCPKNNNTRNTIAEENVILRVRDL